MNEEEGNQQFYTILIKTLFSVTTARKIKDGELLRYKTGFFGSKWASCYMVLMSDSRLLLFNNKVSFNLKLLFTVKF